MDQGFPVPRDQTKTQAPVTVAGYLLAAREAIDAAFEEGYAAAHPELVAAFVQACAIEAGVSAGRIASRELSETLIRLKPRIFG